MAKGGIDPKWLLVAGLVIILAIQMGWVPGIKPLWPAAPSGGATTTPPPEGSLWSQGGFSITFINSTENSMTGASVSPTAYSYRVFHSNGRSLASVSTLYGESGTLLVSGSSGTSFQYLKSDAGKVFVSVYTGTAHFPNTYSLRLSNPGYVTSKWLCVDSPTVPRLVMEIDLTKYGEPNLNVDPSIRIPLHIRVVPEDTSVSVSSPADKTGVGTAAGTEVTITWTVTGITADSGMSIAELYFTSNQTTDKITFQDVTFTKNLPIVLADPNAAPISSIYLPIAEFKATTGGTQLARYIYAQGGNLAGCYLVEDPTGGWDGIDITLRIKTYFSGSDPVTCVFSLRLIDADGTVQSATTDSVTVSP